MEGMDSIISHQREFTLLGVGRQGAGTSLFKKTIFYLVLAALNLCCCASLSPDVAPELLIAQALGVASRALECVHSGCGAQAYLPPGMWNLPVQGWNPCSQHWQACS